MPRIEVLSPVAETGGRTYPLATRVPALGGLKIGWCDNLKANAGGLLEALRGQLEGNGLTFDNYCGSKNATAAAPPALRAHLETCDAVVLAIAD